MSDSYSATKKHQAQDTSFTQIITFSRECAATCAEIFWIFILWLRICNQWPESHRWHNFMQIEAILTPFSLFTGLKLRVPNFIPIEGLPIMKMCINSKNKMPQIRCFQRPKISQDINLGRSRLNILRDIDFWPMSFHNFYCYQRLSPKFIAISIWCYEENLPVDLKHNARVFNHS